MASNSQTESVYELVNDKNTIVKLKRVWTDMVCVNISALTLLSYVGPSFQVEHRPLTTPRQRTQAWAFRSTSFQVYPVSFISTSVSCRQLFLGVLSFSSLEGVPSQGLANDAVWCISSDIEVLLCLPNATNLTFQGQNNY